MKLIDEKKKKKKKKAENSKYDIFFFFWNRSYLKSKHASHEYIRQLSGSNAQSNIDDSHHFKAISLFVPKSGQLRVAKAPERKTI